MTPFKLDSEPKIESGFKTPDNYFENFQTALIERLDNEPSNKETKVISIFRKRKTVLFAVAAVLALALMIPAVYQSYSKSKDLDAATIESYLTEEGHLNQDEIISEIEPESNIIILDTKEIETQTLEDMLASNPNIENLVIEN
ncbi:hypothetical protein [Flavobacterium aquicola]|uniref:Uncharacterized protein n=1 Tax=Flavobacterium aquicola TaxID=1682742 RepID=A0A3E0EU98_9FLAO|nr:hypothetical protein [Flavobacterium aquicola]REH01736.1 hypothetical protein C8P67_101217 [Flavobacterium aquicola]